MLGGIGGRRRCKFTPPGTVIRAGVQRQCFRVSYALRSQVGLEQTDASGVLIRSSRGFLALGVPLGGTRRVGGLLGLASNPSQHQSLFQ